MGFIKATVNSIKLNKGQVLWRQTYDKAAMPQGVFLLKLSVFPDDQGGWFKENLRLDDSGCMLALKENGVDFHVRQSNASVYEPQVRRYWHIHKQQNEVITSNGLILIGLVDKRKDSPTYDEKVKIVMSPDKAVFIPAGVAHGFFNPSYTKEVTLMYFTDVYFSPSDDTQEYRIDPSGLSFDFAEPEVM